MGYGVLGQPTVDTLQSRIDNVEARANRIKAENDELRAENKRLSESMTAVGEFAVTSRLENKAMVPVAVRGVDEERGRRDRPARASRRGGRSRCRLARGEVGPRQRRRRRRARVHRRHAVDVALVRARRGREGAGQPALVATDDGDAVRPARPARRREVPVPAGGPRRADGRRRAVRRVHLRRPGRDPSAHGRHRRDGPCGAQHGAAGAALWSS